MIVQNVTLEQVLAARDRRAEIQREMLEGCGAGPALSCAELAETGANTDANTHADKDTNACANICLVCLTMNIAGEVKRTPMTKLLFDRGVSEFEALGFDVQGSRMIDEVTGSEAFWLAGGVAAGIKQRLEEVEDSFPAARLFDFDVLVPGEHGISKLSREVSRRCLICGGPAVECARSRRHGLDAVKAATDRLLRDFCAETLAEAAQDALLDELYTTPKPGLVDLANCGAHNDMDVPLFEKSAASLRGYFYDAAMLGMTGCTMAQLRSRGLRAEQEMFAATGGVNTHKGMIYSMGLLLAGAGKALAENGGCSQEMQLAELSICNAASLAREDADKMLAKSSSDPSTNGGKVLKAYGAKGATWEAASGFPDAVYCADRLRAYYDEGFGDAGNLAFCDSMARLEDTNLLHRGGPEGLDFARAAATEIAELAPERRVQALITLDEEMIKRNLSPGGSADMLALAFFIDRLRKL